VRLAWPAEANEVFALLPPRIDLALKAAGANYYPWSIADGDRKRVQPAADSVFVRLVTSFATDPNEISRFLDIAGGAIAQSSP
jgi:threonine aldolase